MRVGRVYAARPQIQERLAIQIADFLERKLTPKGVGVIIEARHLCMMIRGVKETSTFKNSVMRGVFLEKQEVRWEFFELLKTNQVSVSNG